MSKIMKMFDQDYKFQRYIEEVKKNDELKLKKKIYINRANELRMRGWSSQPANNQQTVRTEFCPA